MSCEKRDQLKAGITAAAMMLLLLLLINLSVYSLMTAGSDHILERAPELATTLEAQNRIILSLFGLISLVYFAGVVLAVTIPHRRPAVSQMIVQPGEIQDRDRGDPIESLAEELEWAALHPEGPAPSREPDRRGPPL
jgi:hypothetical protein